MINATAAQIDIALQIEGELIEIVNAWIKEGTDVQEIIAALGKTAADTIIAAYGAQAVAPWFTGMAAGAAKLPGAQSSN